VEAGWDEGSLAGLTTGWSLAAAGVTGLVRADRDPETLGRAGAPERFLFGITLEFRCVGCGRSWMRVEAYIPQEPAIEAERLRDRQGSVLMMEGTRMRCDSHIRLLAWLTYRMWLSHHILVLGLTQLHEAIPTKICANNVAFRYTYLLAPTAGQTRRSSLLSTIGATW
jgi:hypothetical protein